MAGSAARRALLGLLLGGALLAAGVFALRGGGSGAELPPHPLARVPATAAAVLWVDLPALRGSEAWRRLVRERGGAEGLRRLRERCGFDVLEGVREAVLWVGSERAGPLGGLALQLRGRLPVERLAACVRRLAEEEPGGALRRVELRGRPALQSASGRSSAVLLGEELLLLGDTGQLVAALDAIDGKAPSALGAWREAWARAAAGASLVGLLHVPPSWLDEWREPRAREALEGLRDVALGVRAGPPVALYLEAGFASAEGARRAAELLERQRRGAHLAGLLGGGVLAEALAAVRLERRGTRLSLSGSWRIEELEALADLLGSGGPPPAAIPPDGGIPGAPDRQE